MNLPVLWTVGLLILSNCFMTMAWYGHLKHSDYPLWKVILVSWGIAFFEYILMVPANRIGYTKSSAYQLKIIQECVGITVFVGFAALFLGENLSLRYFVSLGLVIMAVAVAFYK